MRHMIFMLFVLLGSAHSVLTGYSQSNQKDNSLTNLISHRTQTFDKVFGDSVNDEKESKITDAIFRLSEMKSFAKYLEKETKGKRHLQIMIAGSPDKTHKYYWIKVGEDNGYTFVTHYNFYVYDNPISIFYLDTVDDDKVLSLKQWRQKNGM